MSAAAARTNDTPADPELASLVSILADAIDRRGLVFVDQAKREAIGLLMDGTDARFAELRAKLLRN